MNLNSRGFTLIEVLAVIAIIAVIAIVASPSVLSSLNASKEASYKTLISNIKTAAKEMYEEEEFNDLTNVTINNNKINTTLQILANNGFLNTTGEDNNYIMNPKTKENISNCSITIAKTVDSEYNVTYTITSTSTDTKCPTTDDYKGE